MSMKAGVIDIGSNSVRLMIWADGKTLYKRLRTTRLGEGIAEKPVLRQDAMKRTADAVAEFYAEAERERAERIFVFATAAVRSAENGGAFCALVKDLCGAEVDVVSGGEEALLGLDGALGARDGGVIDVGGASTEVCFRKNGAVVFSQSLNIGAVRLFDMCGDSKVPLQSAVESALGALGDVPACGEVHAVGGTATTLAVLKLGLNEYDPLRVQDCPITADEAEALADKLLSVSAEKRKKFAGMDERRADIIGGGALLVSELMKKLSLPVLYVSERDNLEGYLYRRGIV